MVLIFNLLGLAMVVLAVVIMIAVSSAVPLSGPEQNILLGGLVFVLDLGYRLAVVRPKLAAVPAGAPGRAAWDIDLGRLWLTSKRGGSLMFLPAWLFGLIYPPVLFLLAR